MYCSKCGREIPAGARSCAYCDPGGGKKKGKGLGIALMVIGALALLGGYSNGSYADMMAEGLELSNLISLGLTAGFLYFGAIRAFDLQGGNRLLMLIIAISLVAVVVGISKPESNVSVSVPEETQAAVSVQIPAPTEAAVVPHVVATEEAEAPAETQASNYQAVISGAWGSEQRALDNGGNCGIYETTLPVYKCKSLTLSMQAEGNYGASTKGNWEVHFRMNGEWVHVQTVYYSGSGVEEFTINFNPYGSFDAVSLFPTQRGNYSYRTGLALSNAYFA